MDSLAEQIDGAVGCKPGAIRDALEVLVRQY